ncbi:Hypothetical predicted protein [Octopus vulgaris]|uniref:Uncharacterized protein n=1 Tax=Octopus vulgaris TaxID=6645 RepID=A0AA36B0T9_OCTVU|nr:Hypothetical predicted protein [Octopus vulgaris]
MSECSHLVKVRLGIPENQLIPVTEADIAKAKSLKNRLFVKSNRLWLQEVDESIPKILSLLEFSKRFIAIQ